MSRLYPIVDTDALLSARLPVIDFARAVLEVRPARLQLRAKHLSARETLALLRQLAPLCRAAGCELFANDRPDLAVLADCDGVHLGQDDLPIELARKFAPGLKVGVSTHNPVQLEAALAEHPDYVAFGPVFATRSKLRPDPVVGVEGLRAAAGRAGAEGIELVAIGGIELTNAPQIAHEGITAAVIGALVPPDGDLDAVTPLARALTEALAGAR